MAALNGLKTTGVKTARGIGKKTRHIAYTTSMQTQKGSEQVYERGRRGLHRVQIAAVLGGALLQNFLRANERRARKNLRQAIHRAHRMQNTVQERLQPSWSKTREVLQNSRETARDTLQKGWERGQHALEKRARKTRKQIKKVRNDLKHMQKATQENAESRLASLQEGLKSGLSVMQDTLEEGSQQVRRGLSQVGSSATDARKAVRRRYKHYQRKRTLARRLFRGGLVIGFVLALLFTPVAGADVRSRLKLLWERYKQYSFRYSSALQEPPAL